MGFSPWAIEISPPGALAPKGFKFIFLHKFVILFLKALFAMVLFLLAYVISDCMNRPNCTNPNLNEGHNIKLVAKATNSKSIVPGLKPEAIDCAKVPCSKTKVCGGKPKPVIECQNHCKEIWGFVID